MKVAIIPARGGSKRIPKKNIKLFFDKPLIAWTIEIIKKTNFFDLIIVTTDDEQVMKIANSHGAETPFIRPSNLADDYTGLLPVISHSIKELINIGYNINHACCILPCAPFINPNDLIKGFNLIKNSNSFVYSITEYAHPIQRSLRISNDKLEFLFSENELIRTQDLEKTYHDAGQFYWGTKDAWLFEKKIHSNATGLLIPHWRSVDIDNHEDWKRAEIIFKIFRENNLCL